ncbi:MAG TPA: hypothetical protein VK986_00595, partial [Tepidisphaeraceae bacterium]|nr:hypothetical protein [Tepidisphaeraceae bacterium]
MAASVSAALDKASLGETADNEGRLDIAALRSWTPGHRVIERAAGVLRADSFILESGSAGGIWEDVPVNPPDRTPDKAGMALAARPVRAAQLLVALIALAAAAKPVLFDTLDPDCFWHLRVADQLVRDGVRPLVDDLSFASDKAPWTPYSWLAELGMKSVWDVGGYRAAVLVHALMNAAFVMLVALTCERAAGDRPGAVTGIVAATAVATFVSLPYLSFRPATLAIVLLAGVAYLLVRDRTAHAKAHWACTVGSGDDQTRRSGTRAVWFIVPITALLANVHLFAFLVPIWTGCLWVGATIDGPRRSRDQRIRGGTPAGARTLCPGVERVSAQR